MTAAMTASSWWPLAPAAACLTLAASAGRAWADHGGPLGSAPMSPVLTAALVGALALAVGAAVAVVVMLLTRRPPPR